MQTSILLALIPLLGTLFLGSFDDTFDIPWLYKLSLPAILAQILIILYKNSYHGLPGPLKLLSILPFPTHWIIYPFVTILTLFSFNSINIYAGINGLESGQVMPMVCGLLLCTLTKLFNDSENSQLILSCNVILNRDLDAKIKILIYVEYCGY